MTIQKILCRIIKNEGITQNELARRLGISKQAVSCMLHKGNDMHLSTVITLLDKLGYTFNIEKVGEDDE